MLTLELKFPFFGFSYFQTLIATDCRFDFKWKYLLSYTFRGVKIYHYLCTITKMHYKIVLFSPFLFAMGDNTFNTVKNTISN